MDVQDHKITATSAGIEVHDGVHHCRRCGWPFPKPHPSSKHRRSHKRVCGTVEGYKIIQPENLAVSDDDHASDDDDHRTPSPNIVKKNAESSGRVGEKSFKSEDDVFSDAVTDFLDSGMSPQLEECSGSVSKSVKSDLYGSGALEVEEASDRKEQFNDARSEELSTPGSLANGNNQADNVIPINIAAEVVSVGVVEDSQPEHDDGIQLQGHGSSLASLDSGEGKGMDKTIAAGESEDELSDKFISEAAKDDSPLPSESLQTDASDGVVVHSAEISTSAKAFVGEIHGGIDASIGNKEVSHSTENIALTESVGENTLPEECLISTSLAKPHERAKTLDVTEYSDAACIDKEEIPKTSLDSVGASEGDKFDLTGGNEIGSLESKNMYSVAVNSALGSTDHVFPCEDNNSTMGKKDVDHGEEYTNGAALETGKRNGEEASGGVEAIPDSTFPSEKPNDSPISRAADSDSKSIQELSEDNDSLLEFKDDDFEKCIQRDGSDKVTQVLHTVGSAVAGSQVNEIGDALDNSSLPVTSLEHTESPVSLELQNNDHVETNGVKVESLDVAETVSKLEDDNAVLESESSRPFSGSVVLCESSANDGSSVKEDHKASDSVAAIEVPAEDHESNIESRDISEGSTPVVQGAFPTSQCLKVTSPDIKQTLSSDEFITSMSVDIVSSSEHTLEHMEHSESLDAPSLKQPVPSPSDLEDFHLTSDTVDDKTVIDVEDIIRVDSNAVKTEVDHKPTKQSDDASASDMSSSLLSRSDSLEANCGSVVSDTLETNSQKHKTPSDKSDTFEPPSFMTLVQSGTEGDHKFTAATEIEAVQNNQQPKPDTLQAGWLVNESEGRKKNEEIIAKVTNWSPGKQQHGPLKSLLNEVKSPNAKQVPSANNKVEAETKNGNVGSVIVASETHTTKDQGANKHVEEWNSPARYPIEIKKEKKKGRSLWVPFVCCSSAHRDL